MPRGGFHCEGNCTVCVAGTVAHVCCIHLLGHHSSSSSLNSSWWKNISRIFFFWEHMEHYHANNKLYFNLLQSIVPGAGVSRSSLSADRVGYYLLGVMVHLRSLRRLHTRLVPSPVADTEQGIIRDTESPPLSEFSSQVERCRWWCCLRLIQGRGGFS